MNEMVKNIRCRLCLAIIRDKNFRAVDEFTKAVLEIPLLTLKLEDGSQLIVCSICYERLNAAVEFKSTCLNTNNTIISYADCEKMLQVDLREVYIKEKGSELLTDILDHQKVCKLCMQVTSEFRSLCDEELKAIQMLLPEINTNIVKDPVICTTCFDSLRIHNNFLKDCSEVEKKIGGICNDEATDSQVEAWSLDLFIKTENLEEFEPNEMEISIKTEHMEVPSDDEEKGYILKHETISDNYNQDLLIENNSQSQEILHPPTCKCDQCNYEYFHKDDSDAQIFKFEQHNYETAQDNLAQEAQKQTNKQNVRIFTCEICSYETKNKQHLTSHQLKHKSKSETQIYKCQLCTYETKYKTNLATHRITHKKPSEEEMCKCDTCDFQTKYRHVLRKHKLQHRDGEEVEIYQCNECDFKTRYKYNLTSHVLRHTKVRKVFMHKCDKCEYATRKKDHFQRHQLKHKDQSEAQMYMCDVCGFQTKYPRSITKHQLQHKDVSEVEMFKCTDCDYQTRYKNHINTHVLIHKNLPEAWIYKCDKCEYKAKTKSYLQRHQLRHKSRSETPMYKCGACSYETKYKGNLTDHRMRHKKREERLQQKDTLEAQSTSETTAIS